MHSCLGMVNQSGSQLCTVVQFSGVQHPCVHTIYRIVQLGPRHKLCRQNAHRGLQITNTKQKKTNLDDKNSIETGKSYLKSC